MYWEAFSWILVALCLLGHIFIIKKHVAGQWLWAIADMGWVAYNLHLGAYAQVCLFTFYTGLCFWGVVVWTRSDKIDTSEQLATVN